MKKLLFVSLLCLACSAVAGPTYNVTDTTQINIGNQLPDEYGNWDKLFLDGYSGTYGPGNGFEKVGEFQFTAGPNYVNYVPASGVFDFLMNVAGVTHTINLNWLWTSNGQVDFLDFTNLTDVVFGAYTVQFHNFNAGTDMDSNGNTSHTDLMVKIKDNGDPRDPITPSVPEPFILLLLGIALFTSGLVQRCTTKLVPA